MTPYTSGLQGEQLLMDGLKSSGAISSKVFGMFLGNTKEQSYLEIGGFDSNKSPKNYEPLVDSDHWSLQLNGFRVGETIYTTQAKKGILDAGTSLIYIPKGTPLPTYCL